MLSRKDLTAIVTEHTSRARAAQPERSTSAVLGEAIRKAREAKGLDIGQLAAKLKRSGSAVGMWEKGAFRPDVSIHPKIKSLLGVDVARILKNGHAAPAAP